MSGRVCLGAGVDGRLLARKRASTPAEDAALEHEALMLERARHPGVVGLVGLERSPAGRLELVTAWVGAHSLATHRPRSVPEAAAIVAAVAATVADLHEIGITHNALRPSHVLLDGAGLPVLCDFASASTEEIAPTGADDPATLWSGRADDVASLGRLMHHLLGEDPDTEPIPDSRPRLFALRIRSDRYHRRALRLLADHALAPEPAHRPSTRQLARAIQETVPNARLDPPTDAPHTSSAGALRSHPGAREPADRGEPPGEAAPAGHTCDDDLERLRATASEPAPPRRTATFLIPAALSAAAALALLIASGADSPGRPGRLPAGDGREASTQPALPADGHGPTSERVGAIHPAASCSEAAVVDIDGDGCDDVIEIEAQIVRVGGKVWKVGQTGDSLAAGDWDCDGTTTVAVLRPLTGELFLFETWAEPGQAVEVSSGAILDGAVGFERSPSEGRCGPPRLTRADGTVFDLPSPLPS